MPSRLVPDLELTVRAFGPDGLEGGRSPAFVLDLGRVNALNAGGLGQLVSLKRRVQGLGGRLVLRNVGEDAARVIEAARLTDLLDVRPGKRVEAP
jgi:anti-anti-sigma factor